jgi:hypothetical protein
VSSFSLVLLDVVYGSVLAFDRNESAQVSKNHSSVTSESDCVLVSSIALFHSESICALSYESARPQLAQHLYFAAAPGLSGGCPTSLDPEGSEVWIGCGRHGVIVSSLPQCKHAGHSVALGSVYRILRPLWQCDRFKNIGVSPCLSVCSFLVRSNHGH